MPKQQNPARLRNLVKKYGPDFSVNGNLIYCNRCSVSFKILRGKEFYMAQHVNSIIHKAALKCPERQPPLNNITNLTDDNPKFYEDITRGFIAANIPLSKLNNPTLRDIFKKYFNRNIPDESTLRKNYMSNLFEKCLNQIRMELQEEYIWAAFDETTDADGRYIACIVVGALYSDKPSKPYVLNAEVLERVNNSTVSQFFTNSLNILWTNGVKFNRVLLLLSDAAGYMIKCYEILHILYPKMIHVTCVVHGLQRVCEKLREVCPIANKIITNGKQIFTKSPLRVSLFREINPDIPLPPQPVITRWGTWLDAALYYSKYIQNFREVVNKLNSNDAESIKKAKMALTNQSLQGELALISANLSRIPSYMTKLESSVLPLNEALEELAEARRIFETIPGMLNIRKRL